MPILFKNGGYQSLILVATTLKKTQNSIQQNPENKSGQKVQCCCSIILRLPVLTFEAFHTTLASHSKEKFGLSFE